MGIQTTYYSLAVSPSPYSPERSKLLGYYLYAQTAKDAAEFIKEIGLDIEVNIRKYQEELVQCDTGFTVKQVYDSSVTKVWTKLALEKKELTRLMQIQIT